MIESSDITQNTLATAVQELEQLQSFTGAPAEFWPAYLKIMAGVSAAELAILVIQRASDKEEWKRLAIYPPSGLNTKIIKSLNDHVEEVATNCNNGNSVIKSGKELASLSASDFAVGTRISMGKTADICVAVFLIKGQPAANIGEYGVRLQLLANLPVSYQHGLAAQQAEDDIKNFSAILDMMVLLNAEDRYLAAAMRFCNELSSRFQCDRVSLGWLKNDYIRVQAISHIEKFDKKMDAVKKLEIAMEEALDQDIEIVWPKPTDDDSAVARDHGEFAKDQGVNYACSIPLRVDNEGVAVITCERNEDPFSESEVRYLRLYCDQATRLLDDLKKHDRWFGARWASSARDCLSKLIGVEHTWAKFCGIVLVLLIGFLLFGKLNYRVEAQFTLQSENVAFLPAPFSGYIDKVMIKLGDEVRAGDTLLSIDTHELLLEEAAAIAEKNRHLREAEKARAENALSQMRVAEALAKQAGSRLDLIRHRLSQANIAVPFDGVIVEGDLEERIGAPVETGEVLFKIAKLENLYVELDVDETDVHEIKFQSDGEIAFASRPQQKFPIQITRIDPAAAATEGANIFKVRCRFTCDNEDWWRPGMSGVAKVNVGKRHVWWIFTHKTIDFLRMFFWW